MDCYADIDVKDHVDPKVNFTTECRICTKTTDRVSVSQLLGGNIGRII